MKLTLLFFTCLLLHVAFAQERSHLTEVIMTLENEMQQMNINQADRGQSFISDFNAEMVSLKGDELVRKRSKLKMILDQMELIDQHTSEMIFYLDHLKKRLINQSVEGSTNNFSTVTVYLGHKSHPNRLNLFALSKPLQKVGFYPSDSSELVSKIEAYRQQMIEGVGNYPSLYNDHNFHVNKVETITKFTNIEDFRNQVFEQMNKDSAVNYKEDKAVLIDVYMFVDNARTESRLLESGALLTNLSVITTLQHKILSARSLALAHWASKVSRCNYGFDEIRPVIEGPEIIHEGEKVELIGYLAALDSGNQPVLTVTSHKNVQISYTGDGTANIDISSLSKGTHVIEGTLSIKNKSGVAKTEYWKKTIEVVGK